MFRNMRVGTKLVAIVIPPLAVLAGLAGVGVADRLDRKADAERARSAAETASVAGQAAHLLEIEQIRAAVLAGSDAEIGRAEYEDLVGRTDLAYVELRDRLGRIQSLNGAAERLRVLNDRIAALPELRARVLSGTVDVQEVVDGYSLVDNATVGLYDLAAAQNLDADVAADLGFGGTLAKAKSSRASALTLLAGGVSAQKPIPLDVRNDAIDRLAQADRRYVTFFEQADTEFRALLRNGQANGSARANDEAVSVLTGESTGEPVKLATLLTSGESRLGDELVVLDDITEHAADEVDEIRSDAVRAVWLYLAGAALAMLAALALALLVARSVVRPLRQLTAAANRLSGEQLPALVDRLRSRDADVGAFETTPIPVRGRDEIGTLATSFNEIQRVTVSVAEEQSALLRKGISDLFINLARRNQALLDRQINFIDELESKETDPDQLQNLFRLDHLATRMRRNAESLLVLAGAESARRRGQPTSLADVVRIALGEVEDFTRIKLVALDEVLVPAGVAVDLAHLLAELMENATQFSPPERDVEVVGHRHQNNGYVLSVTDQGIGMAAPQLSELNATLARPPVTGLALGRSLGGVVVGRLAARHGIDVRLTDSAGGGVTALVTVPASLLVPVVEAAPAQEIDLTDTKASAPRAEPVADGAVGADGPAEADAAGFAGAAALANGHARDAGEAVEVASPAEAAAEPTEALPRRGAPPWRLVAEAGPPARFEPPAPTFVGADLPLRNVTVRRLSQRLSADGGDAFTYLDLDDEPDRLAAQPARAELLAPQGEPAPQNPTELDEVIELRTGDDVATEPAVPPEIVLDGPSGDVLPRRQSQLVDVDPGLPRRSPRDQVRDLRTGAATIDPGAARVAASQRSPEEVRRMLSRYRTGLQQGRSQLGGSATAERETVVSSDDDNGEG